MTRVSLVNLCSAGPGRTLITVQAEVRQHGNGILVYNTVTVHICKVTIVSSLMSMYMGKDKPLVK